MLLTNPLQILLQLPIKMDIIKHPSECDGKSTSTHAALLAPDDVNIYTFPTVPNYEPKEKVGIMSCIH